MRIQKIIFPTLSILLLVANVILFSWLLRKMGMMFPATPLQDFDVYYGLLRDARLGIDPYQSTRMMTQGPPLVFLYFLPYSLLPLGIARILTTIVNIAAGITSCWLLSRHFYPRLRLQFTLLFSLILFSAFPTRFALAMGQPDLLLCLLVTMMIIPNYQKLSSRAQTILIVIKAQFATTLIPLFFTRRKIFIHTVFMLIFLSSLTLFFLPLSTWKTYLVTFLPGLLTSSGVPIGLDYYNQSLRSTLFRLQIPFLYIPLLFSLAFLLFRNIKKESGILVALLLGLICTPISWQHYFVLIFPIALVVTHPLVKKNVLAFIAFLCLWWIEIPYLQIAPPSLVNGVLASHYFFAAILLLLLGVGKLQNNRA